MPEHLEHMSKALSYCSENIQRCIRAKDKQEERHWRSIHQVLVYACRDIGELDHGRLIGGNK